MIFLKGFFSGLAFLSTITGVNSLSCVSISNKECQVRPQIVNVNNDESVFFPFSTETGKCGYSCNKINDPYA